MEGQWHNQLPRPIAFAFSGGASLGAVQVGMLRALRSAGIQPDLVVGTSIGALNGVVIADRGFDAGVEQLTALWRRMQCSEIFAGGPLARLCCLLQTGRSLFRQDELIKLMQETLAVRSFADLELPLGVVATDLMSRHSMLFTQGDLQSALLASSAIPGLLPWVEIDQRLYVDGCFSENVPLKAASHMGAASIVVLDSGNRRRPGQGPHRFTDKLLAKLSATFRQQVMVDVLAVGKNLPMVYLPAPDLPPHRLLDFGASEVLMERTEAHVTRFLATAPLPAPGAMCGTLRFCEVQPSEASVGSDILFEQAHTAPAVA